MSKAVAKSGKSSDVMSKFEPRPAVVAKPPESAKANTTEVGPPGVLKTGVSLPKPPEEGRSGHFLPLGGGHQIRVNQGSGYFVLMSIMAKHGCFEECAAILKSKDFNPADKGQASALLSKMMVPLGEVEELVKKDSAWEEHQKHRTEQLSKSSHPTEDEARVRGGKWQGNIREIISTCRGSYNAKPNKNVGKFREAGVVFRLFPLRPRKSDKAFALLFPAEHVGKVKAAINTVHGVNE